MKIFHRRGISPKANDGKSRVCSSHSFIVPSRDKISLVATLNRWLINIGGDLGSNLVGGQYIKKPYSLEPM